MKNVVILVVIRAVSSDIWPDKYVLLSFRGLTPISGNPDRVQNLISQRMLHPDAGLILNTQSESCFCHLFFEAQIPTQQQLSSREETEINHQIENSFHVAPNHFATTAN